MELIQDIFIIAEVFIPVVNAANFLCCVIDCSSSCSKDLHDDIDSKLDGAVFE